MGNAHTHAARRGSSALTLATIALLIMLAVIAVSASIGAQNAQALPTFTTTTVIGVGPCTNCHTYTYGDAFHSKTTHAAQSCSKCHTVNTATPPLPSACASCHGGSAATIIAGQALHVSTGCGTTPGCHGAPSPTPTPTSTGTPTPTPTATAVATTMTAKVTPTTVKLKKTVKVTGTAGPAVSLKGAKVAVKVERKVGSKWVKMKATATATVKPTGAFTWSYKTAKKGAHRVTLSIAKTATYTAKKVVKTFKVK